MELEAVKVLRETSAALLVEVDGVEVWLPKSQMLTDESDVSAPGDTGKLVVTEWIAREKGLV